MTRVRVIRSFLHDGRRLRPGEVVELTTAYAECLIVDGTVERVESPVRGTYRHRLMVPRVWVGH